MLKLLTVTTLYPNAAMPTHAMFVENRLRRIIGTGQVDAHVVAPVPWFPFSSPRFGHFAAFARTPREEVRHDIPVSHPRYLVVPKVGMMWQPKSYLAALRREVRRLQRAGLTFDLIDAHYVYPDGVAAAQFGNEIGKPVVVSARGTDLNLIATLPGPGPVIRKAFDGFDKLITVSRALAEQAVRLGMPESRIEVLRKPMRVRIAGQRVDHHRRHGRVGKTSVEHLPHDFRAVAARQIGFLADPDIDCPQVNLYIAPIVRLLARRIDDLDSSMGVDLVWRQGVSLSPAAEEMMNILRNLSAALD